MSDTNGSVTVTINHVPLTRHLGPAMVGECVSRTTTFLISKYFERQVSVSDKLKKLKLLLFKINSVIEAAEAAMPIGNLSLCRWLSELQDAAREGDDMLLIFKARYSENPIQRSGPNRTFFVFPLLGVFKEIVGAMTDLIWHDYDVDRLGGSLDRLEKISADVGSFLALLELDTRRKYKSYKAPQTVCFTCLLRKESEKHNVSGRAAAEQQRGALRMRTKSREAAP